MKSFNLLNTVAISIALMILSIGAASGQTATVKIPEGAKFDGYKVAYVAIVAEAAEGEPFVSLLLKELTAKGLVASLGFPPKTVSLDNTMTLFVQEFAPGVETLQIYIHDSKSETALAKVLSSGKLTLAQQEALALDIMNQLFGKK